jgi:hypothetical protein
MNSCHRAPSVSACVGALLALQTFACKTSVFSATQSPTLGPRIYFKASATLAVVFVIDPCPVFTMRYKPNYLMNLLVLLRSPSNIVGGSSFRTPSVGGLTVTPTGGRAGWGAPGGHPSAAGALWSIYRLLPVLDLTCPVWYIGVLC